ncbi:MAG: hypothetical protein AAGG45_01595 [Pseudomonadota bacterium]
MTVAHLALRIATWFSAALALIGLVLFAFGAIESVNVILFDQGGSYYRNSVWFHGWAKWLAFPVLAYLAKCDLETIPAHVAEKFQFKHLGWLGWLSLTLFAASIFSLIENLVWLRSFEWFATLGPYQWIDHIVNVSFYVMLYFWLGSLCLYARYRTAALKRLALEQQG